MSTPYGQSLPATGPTCPRHPDVLTYVACQRCGRPTCPACQVPAAVGVHCVDCSAQSRRERPAAVRRAQAAGGTPYVTYGFVALIAVMYVVQQFVPGVTGRLALVPELAWHQPWRLLTNALVHHPTFALHLLGNALMIVLLGRVLEPALGHLRYAVLMLLSALGGTTAVLWTASPPASVLAGPNDWFTPVVGSSTIAYGLMCALLVQELRHRGDPRGILTLLALNVGFSFVVPGISWQGHLGGALAGLAATWGLTTGARSVRPAWIGLVGSIALVVLGAAIIARYALVPQWWGGLAG
ncbi:MAG: rhomboid family intramembrane serine protease [Austwickia sp.]|nr:rhomboid family intramembrane serine protease [Actinomycetota bacterium]MCB1252324.1 rhomboid family intramembrane serine protease [Austwickia sp.]MCO5309560.1 rhomboid family intramembrane serine protease [Austwickia sp.]